MAAMNSLEQTRHGVPETKASSLSMPPDNPTRELQYIHLQKSVWEDWSGRGSHVDFRRDESIPLIPGRCLGWGMNGYVYETVCRGVSLAWKRRLCRSQIGPRERREIEILKKLPHK